MKYTDLTTLTDAGLLEAIRRAASDDVDADGAARRVPRETFEAELQRALAAVYAEEQEP